jgi:hypothetical protein
VDARAVGRYMVHASSRAVKLDSPPEGCSYSLVKGLDPGAFFQLIDDEPRNKTRKEFQPKNLWAETDDLVDQWVVRKLVDQQGY